MIRTCRCGQTFDWSHLGEFAKSVFDRILARRKQPPLELLCPRCRRDAELPLFRPHRNALIVPQWEVDEEKD